MYKKLLVAAAGLILTVSASVSIECMRSTYCQCMTNNYQRKEVEFQCDSPNSTTTTVRIKGSSLVHVECYRGSEPLLPPGVNLGEVENFEVFYCSLPATLKEFLDGFGITSLNSLTISYGDLEGPLTKHFFDGFPNITNLSINTKKLNETEVDTFCGMPHLQDLDLKQSSVVLRPHIFDCLPELLILELGSNDLGELPDGVFKELGKLRVLQLWSNRLKRLKAGTFEGLTDLALLELSSNQMEELPEGIFTPLVNLKQISLSNNRIKVVPADLFGKTVNLLKVKWERNPGLELLDFMFANLPKLESVSLSYNGLTSVPEGIFENSTNIQTVNLANNLLTTIPANLFKNLQNLKLLDLSNNRLQSLQPPTFTSQKSLQTLNLQNNQMTTLDQHLFDRLSALENLRLDHNNLTSLPNFINQRSLKFLNASYNRIHFESSFSSASPLNYCIELEQLDLSHNEIAAFEYDFTMVLLKLRSLDLSFNRLQSIEVQLLQKLGTYERRINLSNNNISFVDFSLAEVVAMNQENVDAISSNLHNTVVSISDNPVACNCSNYELARYYHDELDPRVPTMVNILKDNVRCASSGYLVADLPPKLFNCPLQKIVKDFSCPRKCTCEWHPWERGVVFNCDNLGLESLPEIYFPDKMISFNQLEVSLEGNHLTNGPNEYDNGYGNVTRLSLAHNRIKHLTWVPPKLQVLKLDDNKLSGLDYAVMRTLNGSSLKSLSLGQNPWKCDCSTSNFTKFLRLHIKQIENPNITCDGTTKRLLDLNEKNLCTSHTVLVLYIVVSVVFVCLLVAVGFALFFHYQQVIKVWLFTHNLLLWWVTEEEVDKDKKYDVFICFSHKDDDFVREHLLPELENGPEKYKVCIHYRDWIAGEFIATQIADSVQNSRRTLIVLSRNFLESVWGKMEFRMAHKQSMAEGRARVIVLVYGDVDLKQDLDEELKAYIKTNTYIKWEEPWFWNRLKYALPHSQKKVKALNQKHSNIMQTLDDKFKLVEPVTMATLSTPPVLHMDQLKGNPLTFKVENEKEVTDVGLNPLLK